MIGQTDEVLRLEHRLELAGEISCVLGPNAAVDFVRAHWRFLPASLDGKPIEDWTTVEVTFGPSV